MRHMSRQVRLTLSRTHPPGCQCGVSTSNIKTVSLLSLNCVNFHLAGMFAHRGHDVSLFFSFEEEAARFREGCDANDGVTVKYLDTEYKGKPLVRIDPGGAAAVNRGRVQPTSLHLEQRRIGLAC